MHAPPPSYSLEIPRDLTPHIPSALAAQRIWVRRAGKRPLPVHADPTDPKRSWKSPQAWGTLAEAHRGGYWDVGIVITAGLVGIDIDGGAATPGGPPLPAAAAILAAYPGAWVEQSLSGRGYHLVGTGTLSAPISAAAGRSVSTAPDAIRGVEAYTRGRFFAVTGDAVAGGAATAEGMPASPSLGSVDAALLLARAGAAPPSVSMPAAPRAPRAPHTPGAARAGAGTRGYFSAALAAIADRIASAPEGARHATTLRGAAAAASFMLGRWVTEHDAEAAVLLAARENGLPPAEAADIWTWAMTSVTPHAGPPEKGGGPVVQIDRGAKNNIATHALSDAPPDVLEALAAIGCQDNEMASPGDAHFAALARWLSGGSMEFFRGGSSRYLSRDTHLGAGGHSPKNIHVDPAHRGRIESEARRFAHAEELPPCRQAALALLSRLVPGKTRWAAVPCGLWDCARGRCGHILRAQWYLGIWEGAQGTAGQGLREAQYVYRFTASYSSQGAVRKALSREEGVLNAAYVYVPLVDGQGARVAYWVASDRLLNLRRFGWAGGVQEVGREERGEQLTDDIRAAVRGGKSFLRVRICSGEGWGKWEIPSEGRWEAIGRCDWRLGQPEAEQRAREEMGRIDTGRLEGQAFDVSHTDGDLQAIVDSLARWHGLRPYASFLVRHGLVDPALRGVVYAGTPEGAVDVRGDAWEGGGEWGALLIVEDFRKIVK